MLKSSIVFGVGILKYAKEEYGKYQHEKKHRFQEMFVCKRKTKLIGKNQKIQYIQDFTVQTYQ